MNQGALTKKDRLWIELAVKRVDWVLDGRVPRAKRRQVRNELRSNLIEAASEVGAKTAVRQLGDLNALAKSYLELYRGRFDFKAGTWAAGATYLALQIVGIVLILGFHAGVTAAGGHGNTYSFQFWSAWGPFAGSVSGDETRFMMTIGSPVQVLLVVVAFVIGSSYRTVLARRLKP